MKRDKWEIVWVRPKPLPALICAWYRQLLMRPVPVRRRINGNS